MRVRIEGSVTRFHGRVTVLVLVTGLAVIAVLPVVALGAGSSLVPSPNSAIPRSSSSKGATPQTYLLDVSCTAAKACTAVGDYVNSGGDYVSLAEVWNGTSWAIQTTPNPTGAKDTFLSGVACPSATACTAVGEYVNSAGHYETLAEVWNGTSWAIQTTPNPTGVKGAFLFGVSCKSAAACTAVGDYENKGGSYAPLAEAWDGTSWAIQATANPAGAESTYLSDVSCTSADACVAIGDYEESGGEYMTLAEVWNGTIWAIQTTPNPTGAIGTSLSGVSCKSAAACTAVGDYENSAGSFLTFAEVWNGTSWALQSAPSPTGATGTFLSQVSCPSATACTAAGAYENSAGSYLTLAEVWNGTSWAIQATPNPTGVKGTFLSGVSCKSAAACTAVGDDENSAGSYAPLAEAWNGTSWAIETTPNP